MTGYLTTHVLDTACGRPAEGLKIELFELNAGRLLVGEAVTNRDGRTDEPLLPIEGFRFGSFELLFHVGEYLKRATKRDKSASFLHEIPIRFQMTENDHYHVPLLLSPFGYSTYRGS